MKTALPAVPMPPLLLETEGNNTAFLKNGIARQKFIYPLTTQDKYDDRTYRRICHCKHPCTSSISGQIIYIYPEKIFVHIRKLSAALTNGIIPTKYGSFRKKISTTSRRTSALQASALKMREP